MRCALDTSPDATLYPESEPSWAGALDLATQRLDTRERVGEGVAAAGFVVAALATALFLDSSVEFSPGIAVALLLTYAVAVRVRFPIGPGYTVPTQLVLVPMLFLLPIPVVPLMVAAGRLLGDLPDYLLGRRHPERALIALGDSWHALGPALVLALTDATPFDPSNWPVYLAALGAQFALDLGLSAARDGFELGVPPSRTLADGMWVWAVDALLAPIGLLAAIAGEEHLYLFVLATPLMALLAVFARERQRRLDNALELRNAYHGTSRLLAELLDHDDEYTGAHSRSVVELSVAVASRLRLTPKQMRDTEFAALLHDIGKIAVSKEIINKPGALTDEEWAIMRGHTIEGQRMLDRIGGALRRVGVIVRASHERWDGGGYPDGLHGEAIPVEARIVCACDAFNAMTTDRPYRPAMTGEAAVAEIEACAGTQFDPRVAKALLAVVEAGTDVRPDLQLAS
jgi:hypothetical protein